MRILTPADAPTGPTGTRLPPLRRPRLQAGALEPERAAVRPAHGRAE